MTTVLGISASQSTAISSGANAAKLASTDPKSNTLGYDAFLQLLVAQMQNQDPLEPTNSSDYVAQLATFSQVEKSIEMNDRIADLLSASKIQQAESVIGKWLTSADGQTNGLVTASKVVGNDVIAMLSDGTELVLGAGVVLSGQAP